MGDAEQLNGPRSGKSEPTSKEPSEPQSNAADVTSGPRPASVPPSQAKVRRSSLRPAPADYVPSVRDPSTLRPMMVVRAGDVEPTEAHPPSSQGPDSKTQRPPPSVARPQPVEVFADVGRVASEGPDLVIPPAPAVPVDLVADTVHGGHEQATAREVNSESATPEIAAPAHATSESDSAAVQTRPDSRSIGTAYDASKAAPKHSRWPWVAAALIALGVLGAVLWARVPAPREAPVVRESQQQRESLQPLVPSSPVGVQAPAELEPIATGREVRAQNSAEPANSEEPKAAAPEAAPSPPAGTTRVRLEIKPIDAKVIYRGREVEGPPYEFDVAKGQKIAVEVVRLGFVTAKVVIDDKKPIVSFGMLRARYKR